MDRPLPPGISVEEDLVLVAPDARLDLGALGVLSGFVQQPDGGRVGVLVQVSLSTPPPSPTIRRAMREGLMDPKRIAGLALVHTGDELRSRLIRGVLHTIARGTRSLPVRVFETEAPARGWLRGQLDATQPLLRSS